MVKPVDLQHRSEAPGVHRRFGDHKFGMAGAVVHHTALLIVAPLDHVAVSLLSVTGHQGAFSGAVIDFSFAISTEIAKISAFIGIDGFFLHQPLHNGRRDFSCTD